MHLAAFPAGAPVALPQSSAAIFSWRASLGQKIPPAGVCEHHIIDTQCRTNARGNGRLPLALVERAGHQALQEKLIQIILKSPDEHHPPEHIAKNVGRHASLSLVAGNNIAGFSSN